MDQRYTTIFRQLIYNIVGPAIIALLILGVLNYNHTKNILIESSENKKEIIIDEITHIHELQDMALEILERELNEEMRVISDKLVTEYFADTRNIENVDLYEIRKELGMNPEFEDIYIINREGTVVNTTFSKDKGLNLFAFGEEHKKLLMDVFEQNRYVSERFAMESQTKRLKKFTYQPTLDGAYIVELGVYSPKADETIQYIKSTLNEISRQQENIVSVHLFIGSDNPFSLNEDVQIKEEHMDLYRKTLNEKTNIRTSEKEEKTRLNYNYIYMQRKHTDLYKGSVIRIISDRSAERKLLRYETFKFLIIFGVTILVVIVLLYRKTRVITDPIKKLVENVNRITNGHLEERADVIGNNEITKLSEQFNQMIAQLESYYNELEQKVKERTAEIERQKEEIEAQRDSLAEQRNILRQTNSDLQKAYGEIEEKNKHIEDSIHYAKRIQNAILPPDHYVSDLLGDGFIFYRPKDIVSGDFYWLNKKKDLVMIAAVDCTGHGVPGAFMSIVGNNQLNYAVNVLGTRKPAEILNALNEGVTRTLRQTRGGRGVKDGMDMALCVIDYGEMKLEFAGAYNPMFHIRDHELNVIKGDKHPVGGFLDEELPEFTNKKLSLKKGDMIYIFSDGYADQFGGSKNKKFMTRRFRELLLEICQKPMQDQRDILEESLDNWMNGQVQVDDILVIGVKV